MPEDNKKSELERLKTIVEDIKIYIDDIQHISTAMKGDSILRANMHAYASAQASIDVVLDIRMLLNGEKIASLDEIKKTMEKEKKKKESETQSTPYSY